MSARRLRLRRGLSTVMPANALSVATDGTILRAIGDPQAGMLDHADRKSLMGLIALAVIYAFLEPQDDTDGLTLEQAVAARDRPPAPSWRQMSSPAGWPRSGRHPRAAAGPRPADPALTLRGRKTEGCALQGPALPGTDFRKRQARSPDWPHRRLD